MQNNFIKEIVSGGQTGVDRAALDIAIKFKILHSGWCPFGRKAEDGVIPAKYNLKETPRPIDEDLIDPLAIYNIRTEFNVRDSDGTLIIVKDSPIGGTLYTLEMSSDAGAYWVANKETLKGCSGSFWRVPLYLWEQSSIFRFFSFNSRRKSRRGS